MLCPTFCSHLFRLHHLNQMGSLKYAAFCGSMVRDMHDVSCMYLAHHELESDFIVFIALIFIFIITTPTTTTTIVVVVVIVITIIIIITINFQLQLLLLLLLLLL